ncbi:hypothetical protein ACER0C_002198 [Sarotherodon galilaeus]
MRWSRWNRDRRQKEKDRTRRADAQKTAMGSGDPGVNLLSVGLIDDPQWVSYCVENACTFSSSSSEALGHVCRNHCSRHVCSGPGCTLVRDMVDWTKRKRLPPPECPVEQLLVFRKPQVEFRASYHMPSRDPSLELGYGGLEYMSGRNTAPPPNTDLNQMILTASLPVTVALFATLLTRDFSDEYRRVHYDRGSTSTSIGVLCSPWMDITLSLAKEVAFRSAFPLRCSREYLSVIRDAAFSNAVAVSTLFDCKEGKINRFMRKLAGRYNEKHVSRTGFYTMVTMVSLCLFPYLKHRVLGNMFDNRTLVIMFFDKAITKHNQWSSLSTHVHLHANDTAFAKRVHLTNPDKQKRLPTAVSAILDTYISNAVLRQEMDDSDLANGRQCNDPKPTEETAEKGSVSDRATARQTKRLSSRKRKGPCYGGYYEDNSDRVGQKVTVTRGMLDLHTPC